MLRVLACFLLAVASAAAQTSGDDVSRWLYEVHAAGHGDARAEFWLGVAYERGEGVEQNFPEALRWLRGSANQGNADAQNALGQMYEDGEGVTRDYVQASMWYWTACQHRPDYGGAGQGCNNLGLLYLDGRGVGQSRVEAYKYFKIAQNTPTLTTVMSEMSASEIIEAEHETEKWLQAHPDR